MRTFIKIYLIACTSLFFLALAFVLLIAFAPALRGWLT